MQVVVDSNTFPYPHLFLIAGRAAGAAAPPVEPVGVFVVKQRLLTSGRPDPQQPKEILMTDQAYDVPEPPPETPPLAIQFESDLAPTKPLLDLVAVRSSPTPGSFGHVRVQRRRQVGPPLALAYGWRDRSTAPRSAAAGDVASFIPVEIPDPANPPPLVERLALPSGFNNRFFNGSPLTWGPGQAPARELQPLTAGDRVEFRPRGAAAVAAPIPRGPRLTIEENGAPISPTVPIELAVDTVVYSRSEARIYLTWRAVFPWSDRLESASLVVT